MKLPDRNILIAVPILFILIFVGVYPFSSIPTARASPVSKTLDACISPNSTSITYDAANSLAFISVGTSASTLYKIDLATVLVQGCSAVTPYPVSGALLGNACGGSLAGGPYASTILGANIYVTSWYSTDCIGVSQIRISDGVILKTWTYSAGAPSNAKAIVNDGTSLYVGTSIGVLKLTTSGTYSVLATTTAQVNGMTISGSTLYFTLGSTKGLAKVNTDGTAFVEYACGICSNGNLLDYSNGLVWFSDNVAQKLIKFDTSSSAFTAYPTGGSGDGPYGVCISAAGVWSGGFQDKNIRFFSSSLAGFDGTLTISADTRKPYGCFKDSLNNVWFFAVGSFSLTEIPSGYTAYTYTSVSSLNLSNGILTFLAPTQTPQTQTASSTSTTSSSSTTTTTSSSSSSSTWFSCFGGVKARFIPTGAIVSAVALSGAFVGYYNIYASDCTGMGTVPASALAFL